MSVAQDSEHGLLTTLTEYLDDFQVRVTNPRLHATTTHFQVFDRPDTSSPVLIVEPHDGAEISVEELAAWL